jgi:hypothetical protein
MQTFLGRREIAEFVSGAMAGAMTKAVLAPLETIRYSIYFHVISILLLSYRTRKDLVGGIHKLGFNNPDNFISILL